MGRRANTKVARWDKKILRITDEEEEYYWRYASSDSCQEPVAIEDDSQRFVRQGDYLAQEGHRRTVRKPRVRGMAESASCEICLGRPFQVIVSSSARVQSVQSLRFQRQRWQSRLKGYMKVAMMCFKESDAIMKSPYPSSQSQESKVLTPSGRRVNYCHPRHPRTGSPSSPALKVY